MAAASTIRISISKSKFTGNNRAGCRNPDSASLQEFAEFRRSFVSSILMKKRPVTLAVRLFFVAGALTLASCDKPASGLDFLEKTEEKTVFDAGAAGTSSSAVVTADPSPVQKTAALAPAKAGAPVVAAGLRTMIRPLMPPALIQGTPLPTSNRPPNLDLSTKPVLEASVPEGATLLSKGKPVTCSDPAPLGELSLITDGEKQGDDGFYVDILPQKQWIQIDLGEAKEIHLIWVWHFHRDARIFKDVVVQISDDLEFKTSTTVFNNDFDNSSGLGTGTDQSWVETNNGRSMPVKAIKGRYVRLYSNGQSVDDTNQYIEVEVYGK
jgi:hypothetical protein